MSSIGRRPFGLLSNKCNSWLDTVHSGVNISLTTPPKYLFAFRDRMDERCGLTRAAWDGRFKYIRNYMLHLPWSWGQTQEYMRLQKSLMDWLRLASEGKLDSWTSLYMAWRKPPEMLFDLSTDPDELRNLANAAAHQATLNRMKTALRAWQDETLDLGFRPESEWYVSRDFRAGPRRTLARERPDVYPMQRLRELAELLPNGGSATAKQLEALKSETAGVRYWGAMGLLAAKADSEEVRTALRGRLDDKSPAVRATSAQALVELGETDPALQRFTDLLKHAEPFAILCDATALDHLGERARPALPQIHEYLERQKAADSEQASGKVYPEWVFRRMLDTIGRYCWSIYLTCSWPKPDLQCGERKPLDPSTTAKATRYNHCVQCSACTRPIRAADSPFRLRHPPSDPCRWRQLRHLTCPAAPNHPGSTEQAEDASAGYRGFRSGNGRGPCRR